MWVKFYLYMLRDSCLIILLAQSFSRIYIKVVPLSENKYSHYTWINILFIVVQNSLGTQMCPLSLFIKAEIRLKAIIKIWIFRRKYIRKKNWLCPSRPEKFQWFLVKMTLGVDVFFKCNIMSRERIIYIGYPLLKFLVHLL